MGNADLAGDDRDLARLFVDGDPGAVATIDRWVRYAASSFRRTLGDAELDDVAQDVLVKLTEVLRAGTFRGDSSLETYVRRITAHRCIDGHRRGRRWRTVELDDVDDGVLRTSGRSALDRASDRQRLARFARVLRQLPDHCRDLWSRVIAGASYEEIGREVGVRPGTLRVRLLRCRRQAEALLAATDAASAATGEASARR